MDVELAARISVILPVYNEAESLPILWQELTAVLLALGQPTEIIFVDDGSTDGSADLIRALVERDRRVRLIRFSANAGLTAAFHAGFKAARGQTIVTLDSDLQSDPRDIATLLICLDSADAAIGWRQTRRDPWAKRLSSRVANAIRNAVTGDYVRDSACSLRALRRDCLEAIPPFDGIHRFIPTLLRMAGYRVVEVPVTHRPRRFGRSKYGIRNRAVRAFVDLLAVRWMMARRLRYEIAEEVGGKL
ncbi:MAG: glycosyltransferase family 2 protein [Candidatus Methylomirabilia bacterium]